MEQRGEFLVVNRLYNVEYATPRTPILNSLVNQRFPVLDWPIQRIEVMTKAFPNSLFTVYVSPPSFEELRRRMAKDGRDVEPQRLAVAKQELMEFERGDYDRYINLKVVTLDDQLEVTARYIYDNYLD